ncbi:hypothetical protein JVT61DRAFT_3459 [Boletus reticuloceps]|uniref:Uncharacterized protein n=1 Tax=Boletus reticuloceps TaxID=495285 RepID=A0A8I3A9K2_9AGAM|nr:hypothetical protein JVT61DRAFT_3459 [Boletus reticuloceps]
MTLALSTMRGVTKICPTHQVSGENPPDVKGYATADVFIKHCTIEGLYKV